MTTLSSNVDIDKTKIRKLRVEQQSLEADHKKLQRLIKIAMPAQMPFLNPTDDIKKRSKLLPLLGKRTELKVTHTTTRPANPVKESECESEEDEKVEPSLQQSETETESKDEKESSSQSNSSKRRSRMRVRTKCRDNDMEDAQTEDPDKYSGWVPPQNQSGDGLTELNEKFGY